jgi:hypothetical protein
MNNSPAFVLNRKLRKPAYTAVIERLLLNRIPWLLVQARPDAPYVLKDYLLVEELGLKKLKRPSLINLTDALITKLSVDTAAEIPRIFNENHEDDSEGKEDGELIQQDNNENPHQQRYIGGKHSKDAFMEFLCILLDWETMLKHEFGGMSKTNLMNLVEVFINLFNTPNKPDINIRAFDELNAYGDDVPKCAFDDGIAAGNTESCSAFEGDGQEDRNGKECLYRRSRKSCILNDRYTARRNIVRRS